MNKTLMALISVLFVCSSFTVRRTIIPLEISKFSIKQSQITDIEKVKWDDFKVSHKRIYHRFTFQYDKPLYIYFRVSAEKKAIDYIIKQSENSWRFTKQQTAGKPASKTPVDLPLRLKSYRYSGLTILADRSYKAELVYKETNTEKFAKKPQDEKDYSFDIYFKIDKVYQTRWIFKIVLKDNSPVLCRVKDQRTMPCELYVDLYSVGKE
jgi:hypothetical protein